MEIIYFFLSYTPFSFSFLLLLASSRLPLDWCTL